MMIKNGYLMRQWPKVVIKPVLHKWIFQYRDLSWSLFRKTIVQSDFGTSMVANVFYQGNISLWLLQPSQ